MTPTYEELQQRLQEAQARAERAEAALQKACRNGEARYRTYIENAPHSVFIVDEGGNYLDVNDAACQLTGYSRDELLTMSIPQLVSPNTPQLSMAGFKQVKESGRARGEVLLRKKDGTDVTVLLTSVALSSDQFMAFCVDISERKLAEEALRDSEELNRTTLNAIGDAVIVADTAGKIVSMNPVAETLTGWTSDQARNTPLTEAFLIVNALTRETVKNPVEQVLKTGKIVGLANHTVLIARDGVERQIADSAAPVINDDGETTGVVLVFRDVTKEYEAAEKLRLSEEKFAKAFRTSPYAITITRARDGKLIEVNDAFTTISGYTREEALAGSSISLGLWKNRDDRDRVISAALKGEVVHAQEFEFRGKDGGAIVGLFSTQVMNLDNEPHVLSSINDITEWKQDMEALRQSEERFRLLADMAPVGIVISDPDENTRYISPVFIEMFGYDEEDMPSVKAWWPLAYPNPVERARVQQKWRAVYHDVRENGGSPPQMVYPVTCKDGSVKFIDFKMAASRELNVIIFTDVTERIQAEQAVKTERDRIQQYLDIAGVMLLVLNEKGEVALINRRGSDILGRDETDILGKNWFDNFLPDRVRKQTQTVFNTLMAGAVDPFEYFEQEVVTADGEERLIAWHNTIIRDSDGRITGTLSSGEDITERKLAENAMAEQRAFLQRVIDADPSFIYVKDRESRFVMVNQAVADTYGSTVGNLIGKSDADFSASEEEIEHFHKDDLEVIDGEREKFIAEETITTAEGEVRWLQTIKRPLPDEEGNANLLLGVSTDITERKLAEVALRESEERYRALIMQSADCLILHDREGRIIDVNTNACETYGYSRDELLSMRVSDLDPDYHDRAEDGAFYDTLKPMQATLFEARQRTRDGLVFPVEVRLSPVQFGGKQLLQGLCRDISERIKAREEQEKLQAQLTQAQKLESVGRLAGGVAHDFNNMLQSIIGNCELAKMEEEVGGELATLLNEISIAAQQSANLTGQLLAFARRQPIAPECVNINDVVGGMTNMLRRLIGEDIDLAWLPGDDLWSIHIDPTQIHQILANLTVNARDAIAGVGKITIETHNEMIDEEYCEVNTGFKPGDYVKMVVSDTGCGIADETLEEIFEPFYTTKQQGKGTGLGLAMVYGIIKQNGGFVNVYSEVGEGTTFSIYFARYSGETTHNAENSQTDQVEGGQETILLVEDEPSILRLGVRLLEGCGYTVLAAASPGRAVELTEKHENPIHLLITDVVMPEMNGRELFRKINDMKPGLKLIYMSGYTQNVIAHHGVLEKGIDFIQKPFSLQGFLRKVRQVLDREEEPREE